MQDVETLIVQLEESLTEQERYLAVAAAEPLLAKLASAQPALQELAALLAPGRALPAPLRARLEGLARRAGELQSQAQAGLADLRRELASSALHRQTLTSYQAAQRWSGGGAAFLNEKG